MLTQAGSPFTASMLRDIEGGRPIEADHMLGDLLKRGGERPGGYPMLGIAYAHLKAYEARRSREKATLAVMRWGRSENMIVPGETPFRMRILPS